jgi:hypothetical protein
MKPGILTTEFWATVLTNGIAAVAIIHPGFKLPGGSSSITTFATLAAAGSTAVYTAGRSWLKAHAAPTNPYAGK